MTNIQFQSGAIDAGGCVSNGWELIKPNYWLYFGITILLSGIGIVLSCIPFVPVLFQIFVVPAVTVGIFSVLFREMRREPVEFGMFFKGFDKFVPAMVIGVIHSIPSIIFLILNFTLRFASIIPEIIKQAGRGAQSSFAPQNDAVPLIAGGVIVVLVVVAIVFLIFSIVWGITFFFAIPILADNDIGAIDAIKLSARAGWSNVGGLILLFIFELLITLLGLIALCIGVFFVLPIIYAANAFAYRQVFPFIQQGFNMSPPPPNTYGSSFGSGM
jgi:uncharacterized membrane protein